MSSPVADRTLECVKRYERICAFSSSSSHFNPARDVALVDSADRFRLWASSLGAFHPITDPKSADYRFRQAPAIVDHLVEVLDELGETLEDVEAVLSGERIDQSLLPDGNSHDHNEGIGDGTTELDELCASLPELVTSLFKVSIFVRKGTTRDRYAKAAAANYNKFSPGFDIRHVADKHPKTADQPWLKNRLGNAITTRREYLRYVRDHRNKLAHMPLSSLNEAADHPQPAKTSTLSQTPGGLGSERLTLAPTLASTLANPELPVGESLDLEEEIEDDRSHATSFVSSKVSDDQSSGKLRVVSLPELQKSGKEFECPYCREIIRVSRSRVWKKHVYRDLRAYVCTFEHCTEGLFEDKHSWFRHELDCHRRQWVCVECTDRRFTSSEALSAHMKAKHRQAFSTSASLDSIIQASSRPVSEIAASACPLCDTWDEQVRAEAENKGITVPKQNQLMMPLEQFKRHLADHLEQLALFAKSPNWEREVDSEEGSERTASSKRRERLALDSSEFLGVWRDERDQAAIERLYRIEPNRHLASVLYLASNKDEDKVETTLIESKRSFGSSEPTKEPRVQLPFFYIVGRIFEADLGRGIVRRLAIVTTDDRQCTALLVLPVSSPSKSWSKGKECGLVYTSVEPPAAIKTLGEVEGLFNAHIPEVQARFYHDHESKMFKDHWMIDYGNTYSILQGAKVKPVGLIVYESMLAFLEAFEMVRLQKFASAKGRAYKHNYTTGTRSASIAHSEVRHNIDEMKPAEYDEPGQRVAGQEAKTSEVVGVETELGGFNRELGDMMAAGMSSLNQQAAMTKWKRDMESAQENIQRLGNAEPSEIDKAEAVRDAQERQTGQIYWENGEYNKIIEVSGILDQSSLARDIVRRMIKENTGADFNTYRGPWPDNTLYLHATSTTRDGLLRALQEIEELSKQVSTTPVEAFSKTGNEVEEREGRDERVEEESQSVVESALSSSASETETIHETAKNAKKGKTRMPKRLVRREAIMDLGYPFEEEGFFFVLSVALEKEQIDEVIRISETYRDSEKRGPFESEEESDPVSEIVQPRNKQETATLGKIHTFEVPLKEQSATARVTTTIRDKEVDITNLGLDCDLLEELPEEVREEVIMAQLANQRSRAIEAGEPPSEIDREFFDALPADIQRELLRREAIDRRRQIAQEDNAQPAQPQGLSRPGFTSQAKSEHDDANAHLPFSTAYEKLVESDENTDEQENNVELLRARSQPALPFGVAGSDRLAPDYYNRVEAESSDFAREPYRDGDQVRVPLSSSTTATFRVVDVRKGNRGYMYRLEMPDGQLWKNDRGEEWVDELSLLPLEDAQTAVMVDEEAPVYRLTSTALLGWLRDKFGDHDFNVQLARDRWKFHLPDRQLTSAERQEIVHLRNYGYDSDSGSEE